MGEAAPNVILDAENFGSNCLKIKDFNNFRDDDPAGTEPMGQLSSFQETELANRDSIAKPSVGEDSVFPDEQYATTSDSHVTGDEIVPGLVADEMPDGNIAVTEEENGFLSSELLYLSCQRDSDKPRCKASQMLVPGTKGEASEPSVVEVTVESKLDQANLNPEKQYTASVDFPEVGGDRAGYVGHMVADAQANQFPLCLASAPVSLINQKGPEVVENITPTADIVTCGGGLESFGEYASEEYEQFQNTIQGPEEEISQVQVLEPVRANSVTYLDAVFKELPEDASTAVDADSDITKAQVKLPEANTMIETKDQINFKYSDVKLRADDVINESTKEIPVDNAAISKWTKADAKLDFPEEHQSSAILDAAKPKIVRNNTDYDDTIQKHEEEISTS